MSNKRTYLDPIHHEIVLDQDCSEEKLIVDLIDTPEFQRLRRIRQLDITSLTFQGAEGSRFTHSVGAMHVAHQLTDLLAQSNPSIKKFKALILSTALLHDVGHGPYSHLTEKILEYNHEDWSCKIICGDTQIHEVLAEYDPKLPEQISEVLKKQFHPQFVSHLISSQLDCDRFDYLLRDSYMTGTTYGNFALQRILSCLELDEDNDRIIVSGEKGQIAVEDYLFARYSMYSQVYYHRKNLAARTLLHSLIERARELSSSLNFVDAPMLKLLERHTLEVPEYLLLDDAQMTYHIKRWAQGDDVILSDLAARFLNRRIFKAVRLPVDVNACSSIIERAKLAAKKTGFDPRYYVAIESTGFKPYDYYRPDSLHPATNIMVRTESNEIKELSEISALVAALAGENFDRSWLIYPEEITDGIASIKELAAYV
jgi:HD superfamily phosphohydrolase